MIESGAVHLTPTVQRWECAGCTHKIETTGAGTRTPLHNCPGRAGLSVPMVPYQSGDRLTVVERDDYINGEDVRRDGNGRPIMRAEVHRSDGHADVWVYAPTAYVSTAAQ